MVKQSCRLFVVGRAYSWRFPSTRANFVSRLLRLCRVTIALRLAVSRFVCLKYIIYPFSLKATFPCTRNPRLGNAQSTHGGGRAIVIVKPEYFGGGRPCANHSAWLPSDSVVFHTYQNRRRRTNCMLLFYNTDGDFISCCSCRL